MAAFLEDPRLRQRWNQISHNAETVTENAAAGIWTFQHAYINPCLASVGDAIEGCTAVCLGDREDRARRQRERARGARRSRAEYSFDFYDDWYDDFQDDFDEFQDDDDSLDPVPGGVDGERGGGSGSTMRSLFGHGFFGSWRGSRAEDWDRLLAGSGSKRNRSQRGGADVDADGDLSGNAEGGQSSAGDDSGAGSSGEVADQPRRNRGMSYSKRGVRRKHAQGENPTIIPSTAPLGFLGRLPWKIGGTLRYKPSAANLREHPSSGGVDRTNRMRMRGESQPLLGSSDESDHDYAGGQDGARLAPWQSELAAADASRQYGTAMSSVSAADVSHVGAASLPIQEGTSTTRQRSSTTGSGETSDSFRSRGDLFPSDEEDDEDAVPLDDEFAVALNHVDDRSSGRTRFSSSSSLAAAVETKKGKRRADTGASIMSAMSAGSGTGSAGPVSIKGVLSRSVSRTTMDNIGRASSSPRSPHSPRSPALSIKKRLSSVSLPLPGSVDGQAVEEGQGVQCVQEDIDERDDHEERQKQDDNGELAERGEHGEYEEYEERTLTAEQLREEDERAAREEDEAIAQQREAAARLAQERGLAEVDTKVDPATSTDVGVDAASAPSPVLAQKEHEAEFVPARLPRFD